MANTVFKVLFCLALCCRHGALSAATSDFAVGDIVQITSVLGTEFVEIMRNTLGKIGKVHVINEMNLRVDLCDDYWYYSPDSITKLASAAATSSPRVSSECQVSEASVTMKKEYVRGIMALTCTVNNTLGYFDVKWFKGTSEIIVGREPQGRLTFEDSRNDFVLQIKDMQPDDVGWYTCELRNERGLLATGALEIERLEKENPIVPTESVQRVASSSVKDHLRTIRELIVTSSSELGSKIEDIKQRLEIVELKAALTSGHD